MISKNIRTTFFFILIFSLLGQVSLFSSDHAYTSYKCISATPSVGSISPLFQIVNDGSTNIRLTDLTVRYWYTIDSSSGQTFNCDSAVFGASNVYGTFVQLPQPVTGADYYLQVSFSMGAGILGPGDSSGEIQIRINKNDWSNYDQSNDYSFDPAMTNFTPQPKISVYLYDSLIYGTDLITGASAPPYSASPPGTIYISIDTDSERSAISPYVYGGNQMWSTFNTETEYFWSARRFGGNRATTYNWENNASNAGKEDLHKSDDFWCTALGLPSDQKTVPARVITAMHDECLSYGWYTLLSLQMAGYASADMNGTVASSEAAPSSRWNPVYFNKGSDFVYPPSLEDNAIYLDELVYYLVQTYGTAAGGNGIKGYALDNETELWYETHPYVHPSKVTCEESVQKAIALSKTIKDIDPSAEIFGPALYGFNGFYSLQDAPDWATTYDAQYEWFVDMYLERLKAASDSDGRRLLDVFDVHWYPEARGGGSRITFDPFDGNNTACNKARMAAPRTLWDGSCVENSWIAQWHQDFMPLIPRLRASIDEIYPGTRLAITEYNYGGDGHVSGGIAQADVLGIFGKYEIYFATYWAVHAPQDYASAAFKLYRNYNGSGSRFGSTSVLADTSDIESSSVFASIEGSDDSLLHVIAMNKSYDYSTDFAFSIASPQAYTSARVWGFDYSSSAITERAGVSGISGNSFTYPVPRLTALHFVIEASGGQNTPAPTAVPTALPTTVPTPDSTPGETQAPTSPPAFSLGDVNHDWAADIVDSMVIAQYFVGLSPAQFDPALADADRNGSIEINDALAVARLYVGLIQSL